jgi:adenylylsulfate kinase
MNKSITPHSHQINQEQRSRIKGHLPAILWFTGLSGSGKSTLANAVEAELNQSYAVHSYLLDGDNIRAGLNQDLTFSSEDRSENIRRIGEVSKLLFDAGLAVLTAFISPFQSDRDQVRALIPAGSFFEIYVDCPLEVCEQRDPKGLYKKARQGAISEFTGISSPYEPPAHPEIVVSTADQSLEESVSVVINTLKRLSYISE